MRGKSPSQSPSQNDAALPNRHSREACPRPRSGSGNPEGPGEDEASSPSRTSMSVLSDPNIDCYYEPLNPTDQAIFDYQLRLESGDSHQAEVPYDSVRVEPRPELAEGPFEPPPAAWKQYELALVSPERTRLHPKASLSYPTPSPAPSKMPTIRSP